MKNLIVKGDFVETSQSDKEFLREIVKILQEKSEGYYYISFRNEFTRNKYHSEFAKIKDDIKEWADNLNNYDKQFILDEFNKTFLNDTLKSYFESFLEREDDVLTRRDLLYIVDDMFISDMIKTHEYKTTKDLFIQYNPSYIYLELSLIDDKDNLVLEIETLFNEFGNGTGEFTVKEVIDKNTREVLEIDDIFESPSFDTEAFGNYSGSEEISYYLDEQLPNGMTIDEIKINYIKICVPPVLMIYSPKQVFVIFISLL